MSERKTQDPVQADLVAELRRVDDAVAQLRPGRDDALLALLDEDPVARVASRSRTPLFAGVAAAALCGALALALWPSNSSNSSTSNPSTSNSSTVATTTPSATTTTTTTTTTTAPTDVSVANAPARPTTTTTTTSTSTSTPEQKALVPLRLVNVPKIEGQKLWQQRDGVVLQPLPLAPKKSEHAAVDNNAVGVANATVTVGDEEVEAALAAAAAKRRAGDFAGAAAALADVLAKNPDARVSDTLSYERALLLEKAGDHAEACAALARHAARFPNSKNARDVAALRGRCP